MVGENTPRGGEGGGDAGEAGDDPAVPPQVLTVDGAIVDYFVFSRIPSAAIATVGLAPERAASADAAGAFLFVDVPAAGLFRARVTPPGGRHLPTLNEEVALADHSITHDLYALSIADVDRQYATVGSARDLGSGTVIVDLRDAADQPLEGVAATALSLRPTVGGDSRAPRFLGALGDVDPAAVHSQAFGGRARAVFLGVPPGEWTLQLDCTACTPAGSATVPVAVEANAVTLARATSTPAGTAQPLTFVGDIYPLLQSGARGGAGCANCHTAGGFASLLPYDGSVSDTYRAIMAAGVVDIAAPAASPLLTRPLYEVPADHPNATWLSTSHPDYQRVLAWIGQGAPL